MGSELINGRLISLWHRAEEEGLHCQCYKNEHLGLQETPVGLAHPSDSFGIHRLGEEAGQFTPPLSMVPLFTLLKL
jgi:hypothetical protein